MPLLGNLAHSLPACLLQGATVPERHLLNIIHSQVNVGHGQRPVSACTGWTYSGYGRERSEIPDTRPGCMVTISPWQAAGLPVSPVFMKLITGIHRAGQAWPQHCHFRHWCTSVQALSISLPSDSWTPSELSQHALTLMVCKFLSSYWWPTTLNP